MNAIWDGRSDRSMDEQVVRFGDRSTGRGNFEGKLGAPIVTNGDCGIPVQKCVNCLSCDLGWCMGSAEASLY